MVNCCVPGCTANRQSGKYKGVSFHEFPSDSERRERWIRNVSRDKWTPSDRAAVCSQHFKPECYVPGLKIKKLNADAVPTIFSTYPTYMREAAAKNKPRKLPAIRQCSKNPAKRQKTSHDDATLGINIIAVAETTTECEAGSSKIAETEHHETSASTSSVSTYLGRPKHSQKTLKMLLKKLQITKSKLQSKCKHLQAKVQRMEQEAKSPFTKYEEKLKEVASDAAEGNVKASILLEQLSNYKAKKPKWTETVIRHCLLWRLKSTCSYFFARKNLLNLPSPSTLKRYIGSTTGETGITTLIKQRLLKQSQCLAEKDRIVSIIVDEMSIKPSMQYVRHLNKLVGYAENSSATVDIGSPHLANRLLCFVISGLTVPIRFPVAYFFTKCLTGSDLKKLTLEVIVIVEAYGFRVIRLVADNSKVNVNMFQQLQLDNRCPTVPHPVDATRKLYLSYDPCHIIKNVRSLYLNHKRQLTNEGHLISPKFVRKLYDLQKDQVFKPVRFLTRKHVFPSNLEKMQVRRALDLFSSEVIASLRLLQKYHPYFVDAKATIEFTEIFQKWFQCHDVHNTVMHIHKRCPNKVPYFYLTDERLSWMENDFMDYLQKWENGCSSQNEFLSEETAQALRITTISTVECIRYLLGSGLHFVLTRKFNSDVIEGLFSGVRQMLGRNDQADAPGVMHAMEKILKIGLIAPSSSSNVRDDFSNIYTNQLEIKQIDEQGTNKKHLMVDIIIKELEEKFSHSLEEIKSPPEIHGYSVANATYGMIAGYFCRLLWDKIKCSLCLQNLNTCVSSAPLLTLIKEQDRGGLSYPSRKFHNLISAIGEFLKNLIGRKLLLEKNIKTALSLCIISRINSHKWLSSMECPETQVHFMAVKKLISHHYVKIFLQNYGKMVMDIQNNHRNLYQKPLSRKVLKL